MSASMAHQIPRNTRLPIVPGARERVPLPSPEARNFITLTMGDLLSFFHKTLCFRANEMGMSHFKKMFVDF
jgi:hypothetical protein